MQLSKPGPRGGKLLIREHVRSESPTPAGTRHEPQAHTHFVATQQPHTKASSRLADQQPNVVCTPPMIN